jgi:hypothetical protein
MRVGNPLLSSPSFTPITWRLAMKVGTGGGSWKGREDILPEDAAVYKELDAWQLLISRQEKCLIIDTKDYHPGLLFLSREDLARVIQELSD